MGSPVYPHPVSLAVILLAKLKGEQHSTDGFSLHGTHAPGRKVGVGTGNLKLLPLCGLVWHFLER